MDFISEVSFKVKLPGNHQMVGGRMKSPWIRSRSKYNIMPNTMPAFRRTIPLLVSQTIGAFNDNAVKAFLPVLAAYHVGKGSMDLVNQQVSFLLILPFIIFAPLAGWTADRFSKKRVIGVSLLAQLIGLGILAAGTSFQSLAICMVGFFFLSTQSSFLSPAKKGILKEMVGYEQLGKAVGWMEMLTIVGILVGAFSGAVLFDRWVVGLGGWATAQAITLLIAGLALVSWLVYLPTPETKVLKTRPFHPQILYSHLGDLVDLLKRPGIKWAALGDACFWAVGGFFYLLLVKLSGEVTVGKVGMGSLYGYWFLLMGMGIMVGCLFCAYLNRGRIELGLCPIGAIGMTLSLVGLYQATAPGGIFELLCISLGFFGALFFVPLNGYLQDRAGEQERGKILAASNLLTQLGGISLIGTHALFSNVFGMTAKEEMFVLIVPLGFVALVSFICLFEDFLRVWFHLFLRIFYRIKIEGMENFPERGGVLLVSNHLSYADPVFIGAAFPRKVRYLAHADLANSRILKWVFRLTETLTISSSKSLASFRQSIERLGRGVPLCLFAEGGISRVGVTLGFKRGSVLLAKYGKVPILPVYLDGVWGSVFSRSGGSFFWKFPRFFPYRMSVRVGSPISFSQATSESVRQEVLELGRLSFNQRMPSHEEMKSQLCGQVFRKRSGVFLINQEGLEIKWDSFIEAIRDPIIELPNPANEWAKRVRAVTKHFAEGHRVIYTNWIRLKETNLLNCEGLLIEKSSFVWYEQWFPWFPLLNNRTVLESKTGEWEVLKKETIKEGKSSYRVTGLASPLNGLIALNLPNENEGDTIQPGHRHGTLGRLLPGFSYQSVSGELILKGLGIDEELIKARNVDPEGFLLPE